ncbi:MAG: hypothetical protein A2522_06625 [Gallionellales bacterium RIFOXYD12_FULL_53_10]|nr:MAG: hypothetical protein A2Z87_05650 [Gallionellales bacterium GWA2_54_124]OGT20356.1 MAG: hypothetical protein A2522_06625 [Gallionellales bacterium RIFOXYD12_FULL_53_10]
MNVTARRGKHKGRIAIQFFKFTVSHSNYIIFLNSTDLIYLIFNKKLTICQRKITQNETRLVVYKSAMSATQHYLNNTLNMFELIKYEFEEDGSVSKDTFQLLQRELAKTQNHVAELANLDNPTPENINAKVKQSLYAQ